MSGLTDYRQTVNDFSASSAFSQWKKQNPKEFTTWAAWDKALQAGDQPTAPVLSTKFGKGMVDAGIQYQRAWDNPDPTQPPPVTPPVDPPVTPPVTPPSGSGTPFQKFWDSISMPQKSWNAAKTITSQSALDSWLGSRQTNDHVICKGFTYNGRLEIRGGGAFWMECDPTFKVTNKQIGSSAIG